MGNAHGSIGVLRASNFLCSVNPWPLRRGYKVPFPQISRVFHRGGGVAIWPSGWYSQQVAADGRK